MRRAASNRREDKHVDRLHVVKVEMSRLRAQAHAKAVGTIESLKQGCISVPKGQTE